MYYSYDRKYPFRDRVRRQEQQGDHKKEWQYRGCNGILSKGYIEGISEGNEGAQGRKDGSV